MVVEDVDTERVPGDTDPSDPWCESAYVIVRGWMVVAYGEVLALLTPNEGFRGVKSLVRCFLGGDLLSGEQGDFLDRGVETGDIFAGEGSIVMTGDRATGLRTCMSYG